MIVCSMQEVTQTYGSHTVFSRLSCEVKQGERIGLIGRNGEGKTTVLKLMARKTEPSEGQVVWKKDLSVGLLEQLPAVPPHETVYDVLCDAFRELLDMKARLAELENELAQTKNPTTLEALLEKYGTLQEKFQENGGYAIDANISRIASGLGLSPLLHKQWRQLSGGERTKVGLAKLLLQAPDLLLLDEPTNHLDLPALEWLSDFVKHYDGTVVIVSHDRYFLDEVVTGIVELEQGELHVYHSNYSAYVLEREERLLREFQQYHDQQKKIKKMKEAIKRLKEWANRSNPPNDGMHRRAKSMEKALARIDVLTKPALEQRKMALNLQTERRSGNDVFIVEDISKRFGNRTLFRGVSLTIRFQERVAIVGANGSGKTTLLNMLQGKETVDKGEIRRGSNLSIGVLSQHGQELTPELTVLEEFRDKVHVAEGEARGLLARFLFYGAAVFRQVGDLSGGERMRLRLAQLAYQQHNVLILDEPTNHLDLAGKEVLEEALSEFPGTIVAVSHDRYFLDQLFDTTYWLAEQQLTRYEGNYSFARGKQRL